MYQQAPMFGTINLRVIQARLMHNEDAFSKMDPYVVINCDGQNHKTNTKANAGKYPVWNQNF